jgi:hypothetical protein
MTWTGDRTTEPRELADKIFSIERSIRYVGIVGPGPKYELLESRMRGDVKSLTPMKTADEFVEIVPQIILGAYETLGPIARGAARDQRRCWNADRENPLQSHPDVVISIEKRRSVRRKWRHQPMRGS